MALLDGQLHKFFSSVDDNAREAELGLTDQTWHGNDKGKQAFGQQITVDNSYPVGSFMLF